MSAEIMTNFESVAEMIGMLEGMSEGFNRPAYVESLIKQAHGKAASAFDVEAAAVASTGRLSHVYEYGAAGITPGPARFSDPTSPAARLYVHTITGTGGTQDVGYSFRPAKQRNPQPTVASTGVPSKYLAKLSRRKYIFWNRAYVMETGETVEIKSKNSDWLFVPFRGQPPSNPLNRRGFVMWNTKRLGSIENTPGAQTKGQFTAFWMNWWARVGNGIVTKSMEAAVLEDMKKTQAASEAAVRESLKPVQASNLRRAVAKGKSAAKRFITPKRYRKVI